MIKYLTFAFLFAISTTLFAQNREKEVKQLRSDVEELAHKKYKGREAGTKGEKAAASYIAKRFKAIGLTFTEKKENYFQKFSFPKSKDPHTGVESEEEIEGLNVFGLINNGSNSYVIIGAHFDHLGMGGEGSGSLSEEEEIHNGADDNASGVAVMLDLAQRLMDNGPKRNNYIFVAFTGEEKGLYGSNNFLKNPPYYLNTMNYMINLDMVGRYNPDKGLIINGVGTSPIWKTVLEKANTTDIKITTTESGIGHSDQTSFYLKDIPAIHFFTGSHEDYHKPSDDVEKINYNGMADISAYIIKLIEELNTRLKLAFSRTKDEDMSSARFKITLGVIPDYLFDGNGMRIEGVREGKPAMNAGIIAGDIVLKIGEISVTDMKTYMIGLGKLEEGKITKVLIQRGDEEMEFDVQF